MAPLAGLLRELGHEVSGSDIAFDPPMGPALVEWGVRCVQGFSAEHLEPVPDMVVIGNVCRPDNVEARAAIDRGLPYTHIAGALARFALEGTSPLVVAGTHGKTTTTALSALLLDRAGLSPGYLVGGRPKDLPRSFRKAGPRRLSMPMPARRRTPFVIEGDEYDTAFFEKTPKFWHYQPEVAILTSIELDHIDIYPNLDAYLAAFSGFVARIPEHGLLVANAADPLVRRVAAEARAEVAYFALEGEDTGGIAPHWLGAPARMAPDGTTFDLFAGGVACGRLATTLSGRHNVKNAVAALAAVVQGYGVPLEEARAALATFSGVARRQDLLGTPRGIHVYDDFAHHPTAVRETLLALRARHPEGRLIAVFEPRSATACRKLHQDDYPPAFAAADVTLLAPLGRGNLPTSEVLDVEAVAAAIRTGGGVAEALGSHERILERVEELARPGDVVALLSNGAFGGVPRRLLERLGASG